MTRESLSKVDQPIRLPLKVEGGVEYFWLSYYEFGGQRWVSAHVGEIGSGEPVPLRIESACFFGHVLGSQQCDCGFQLEEALRRFVVAKRGLLIYGVDQDARGLGLARHFEIYRMRQHENLDTLAIFEKFDAPLDSRSYEPVVSILRSLGVGAVRLLSNNLSRETFLRENGIEIVREDIEGPMTDYNMATLMLEKEDLGYAFEFRTHGEWLAALQARVRGRGDLNGAQVVSNNEKIVMECMVEDWSVADRVAQLLPEGAQGRLVVYLTDLPRLDEVRIYARLGIRFIVVPFAEIPEQLSAGAKDAGIRLQDWERSNAYAEPRPQWILIDVTNLRHIYRKGLRRRTVEFDEAGSATWFEENAGLE